MPGQGHTRKDLTKRPVLFFPLYSFLVVYQPEVTPLRIMAVLRQAQCKAHFEGTTLAEYEAADGISRSAAASLNYERREIPAAM